MRRRLLFVFVSILFIFLSYLFFLGIRVKADSCSDTTVTCGQTDYACQDEEGKACPLVNGLCKDPCENQPSGCGTGTTKTLNCGFDDKGQCTANCNRQWADGTVTDCVFEGSCPNITATPTPTPGGRGGGASPTPTHTPTPTPGGGGGGGEQRRALNRPAHHGEGLRPHADEPEGLCFNEHGGSAPCEFRAPAQS